MAEPKMSTGKIIHRYKGLAVAALVSAAVFLHPAAHGADSQNLVDTLVAKGQFKTLVTAVRGADMEDELRQGGPYTVLAPTDKAFPAMQTHPVDALLRNKAKLIEVLNYHVLPGWVLAYEIKRRDTTTTRQGQTLSIRNGTKIMVDDATILDADIIASNGVIHAIDKRSHPKSSSE